MLIPCNCGSLSLSVSLFPFSYYIFLPPYLVQQPPLFFFALSYLFFLLVVIYIVWVYFSNLPWSKGRRIKKKTEVWIFTEGNFLKKCKMWNCDWCGHFNVIKGEAECSKGQFSLVVYTSSLPTHLLLMSSNTSSVSKFLLDPWSPAKIALPSVAIQAILHRTVLEKLPIRTLTLWLSLVNT